MASPHNVNNLWSIPRTCHWSLPHLKLHLVSKGWMVYCAVNNEANSIFFITETDLIWDISDCRGTARDRIPDAVHVLRLVVILHSYNTDRRQIWSICHLPKGIILVAIISSTGLVNIGHIPLTFWGCASRSIKPHQMSENKGSTISVRLNAEELIGVITVGKVIVRNTSLDGVANVVISTTITSIIAIHNCVQE